MTNVDTETGEVREGSRDNFALEPSAPGTVPERVIDELRRFRRAAKDYTKAYSDAVEAQAVKHDVKTGALKRYIAALEDDKLEEAEAEADDLARLIEGTAE